MNRLIILILTLFLLNNCSLNKNSRLWQEKESDTVAQKNITKLFTDSELVVEEFNPELKLDLNNIKTNNKIIDNKNN